MTETQIIASHDAQEAPVIRDGFIFTRDADLPQLVYVNLLEDGAPALSIYSGKLPCAFDAVGKLSRKAFAKMMASILPSDMHDRIPGPRTKGGGERAGFTYLNLNPAGRHTGDCVYRSLALFLGLDYRQLFWDLTLHCAETGLMQNYRSGYRSYLERHGLRPYTLPRKEDGTKPSVGDFLGTFARKGKRYLVETSRHCTCIKGKTIHDIGDCSTLLVQQVWERDEAKRYAPLYADLKVTAGTATVYDATQAPAADGD